MKQFFFLKYELLNKIFRKSATKKGQKDSKGAATETAPLKKY